MTALQETHLNSIVFKLMELPTTAWKVLKLEDH